MKKKIIEYIDVLFFCLGIAGWCLFYPYLFFALFNDGFVVIHFNLFYEIIFELLGISCLLFWFIYYFIHKVREI